MPGITEASQHSAQANASEEMLVPIEVHEICELISQSISDGRRIIWPKF
jgi:hypothetical protein